MFFTEKKLVRRTEELREKRYYKKCNITPFQAMEGKLSAQESNTFLSEIVPEKEVKLHDFFVGRDRYLWLEKTFVLPEKEPGCEVIGFFDFGNTGAGGNWGFESMLYVNGQPYQGVDSNHKEVFFSGLEGQEVTLNFLLWTGLEGGGPHKTFYHQCKEADIRYLHKKTDELYYFALAITETLEYMEPVHECYHDLRNALDRAFLVVDWDGDDFYDSIEEAYVILMSELNHIEKHTDVTVNVIGHTHIDVAWLWRLKHTREKAQRSFSTVLRLMERYEEYTFLQSQPQLYQYIKEDCPELYEKIKEKVAEGKWEADGGMWVEADCNLSSGESLVRQFLYGTRFYEKEFGKRCKYLWLPDVFGYSWALPQILKQCELESFMTTKISWNQYNTIPNDLFWWKGMDGTKILTYFIDIPEVGMAFEKRFSTYNGFVTPRTLIGGWTKFKDKNISKDILLSYGYGDGGGGVNRDMLEMSRVLEKIPGLPHVKQTKAGEFFDKIHKTVENTDQYVHTWDGELYLEYHRGTYTTQGYNKFMNRYLENQLKQVECLSAAACILGGEYAVKQLHDAWETVLLHQFHDIIPGSSIGEVYADSRVNYAKAQEEIEKAKEKARSILCQKEPFTYTVYSSNCFAKEELVWVSIQEKGYFINEIGERLPAQRSAGGYRVLVCVEPFAGVVIRFCPGEEAEKEGVFSIRENVLQTPFYQIRWNEKGQIESIFDQQEERELILEQNYANALEMYEDKPMDHDAWDVDIYHFEKGTTLLPLALPTVKECGNLCIVLEFAYATKKSKITQNMILYKHTKRIDFETHVDWHENHKLLKAAFYTNIRTTKATYDIQFGHVERPTHWNHSWDWAKFEVCGHKWADISESNYGISLLNNGKYGHGIKDGVIRLSLLRSPKYPDTTADMGEHHFTYSLFPHQGNVTEGSTIEEANLLNLPAIVLTGKMTDQRKLIKVNTNAVQIDAVKKAEDEDAIIVRLHECRGGRSKFTLESEYEPDRIIPCNLLEHNIDEPLKDHVVRDVIRPFEIKTYKLFF